jgi:pimeloyl-ACP methyl ester carboxylesterase
MVEPGLIGEAGNTFVRTVKVRNYTFSYRECGQGEPLVLLHGHISDQRAWLDLEPLLGARFRVYNYSRRFAWPNEPIKDDERAPWESDALDLTAFIEALRIAPVHVLGNSSGAVISLLAARTNPELFRTLSLEEPPLVGLFLPSLPPSIPALLSFLISHPITFWAFMFGSLPRTQQTIKLCKQGDYDAATEWFCQGVINPRYWPRLKTNPERKRQVDDNAKWLCQFFRYSAPPAYTANDARKLEIPTLVMAGQESTQAQRRTSAELHRVLGTRKKRMAYIEKAAHLMHEDNPAGVFRQVASFVLDESG